MTPAVVQLPLFLSQQLLLCIAGSAAMLVLLSARCAACRLHRQQTADHLSLLVTCWAATPANTAVPHANSTPLLPISTLNEAHVDTTRSALGVCGFSERRPPLQQRLYFTHKPALSPAL
jgi:hypothetical protein